MNSDSDFDLEIAPARRLLSELLTEYASIRAARGNLPDAHSEAMHELATERDFAGEWGSTPVYSAHSTAAILLAGAADQFNSMVYLLSPDHSPVYGAQTLARSGLEMAGRSLWLTAAGVGVRRRVARFQTERLYSIYEQQRLYDDKARASDTRQRIFETARTQAFTVRHPKKRAPFVDEPRPHGSQALKALLGDTEGSRGLGHTMFGYLAAVDHGTLYGLIEAVIPGSEREHLAGRQAAIGLSAGHVNQLLVIAVVGFSAAASSFSTLFGWLDEPWFSLVSEAPLKGVQLLGNLGAGDSS